MRSVRDSVFSSFVILALFALSACNETVIKGGGSFGQFNPSTCGTKGIAFASVNTQIFIRNCTVNGCHAAGPITLTTFEGVRASLAQVKDAVLANRMPFVGPLSAVDKELLVTWINQGAPLREEDANLECMTPDPQPQPDPEPQPNPQPDPQPQPDPEPQPNPQPDPQPDPEPDPDPAPLLQPTYESLKTQVFAQNCLGCHRAGSRIGDFSSYEAITAPAVADMFNQASPERSEFVVRLVTDNQQAIMPPVRTGLPRLSPEVVEVIKTWIANGRPRE